VLGAAVVAANILPPSGSHDDAIDQAVAIDLEDPDALDGRGVRAPVSSSRDVLGS
jgi:hypothetical protein